MRWVADAREEAVQTVAKLVEQGARVVEAEERRVALRKVVVVDDDRQHLAIEALLLAVAAHPGAGMLSRPREIVVQKQADRTTAGVAHLIGTHIRVINGAVATLDKAQAEQPPGSVERGLDDVVEHEIRLHRSLVERVFRLPHLLGVVAPIPGRDRLIEAIDRKSTRLNSS